MGSFRYHESLKSRIKVFYKKQKWIFRYRKARFLNRKDAEKVKRINYHIENIKRSNTRSAYRDMVLDPTTLKIAVYTCIFGAYDSVKKINCKSRFCDYWIITDRQIDPASGWKIFHVDFPEDIKDASPTIKNRYCKMHPHILFPNYPYSIYMDGSIQIDADIFPLLGRLGAHFIGMYDHYRRDCIYEEAKTVIRTKKAPEDIVTLQMQKYHDEGFPEHFGLTEGCIIVRRHNDPVCIRIMEEWWSILLQYAKRDQLGLMYVLWKNGFTRDDIATLGYHYEYEARISSEGHKNGR